MVTWTTYGTWLEGEKKGYVKKGRVMAGNLEERVSYVKGHGG